MYFGFLFKSLQNPIEDLITGLELWCVAFNEFAVIFFGYMKYILAFILLVIGILTLLKFRGIYGQSRLRGNNYNNNQVEEHDSLYKPRLIVGTFYIVIASGILLNWFTYFLIIILEPLPDRLIFNFLNFNGDLDPFMMNRIMDINAAIYPHEQTIYYCVALASFGAIVDIMISIWYLVSRVTYNPKLAFGLLIGGVTTGILTGFTTSLPFFI
ncbi:MAG: hypothetical protein ACXAB8_16610 [Promethearchaeota archaeon]|jgi:hypothetical protein